MNRQSVTPSRTPYITEYGLLRLSALSAGALACASARAAETAEANPKAYLQAFNDTCRHGFPDVDAIAGNATAHGWTERSMPVFAGGDGVSIRPPRLLSKGGLMLFLGGTDTGPFRTTCQITGSAGTRLTGRDVAALVGPSLNGADMTRGPGDYKKDDYALWMLAPGVTVQAGVSVYRGKTRTISITMRQAAASAAAHAAVPAARPSRDIPMVAIGLPFAPESPAPVGASHPLFHDVSVAEIEGLPPTLKSSALNVIAAAKRSSINAALSKTFRRMNLLAQPAAGRKRLFVTWKGDKTPFRIGTSNSTAVAFHYRLVRVDSGQLLFERDITTTAQGGGADASMRDNGIVRAAIGANFASAANCLDRAAFGTAPADCALTPGFSVSVVRVQR